MTNKLSRLRELAAEATPGKWVHDDGQIIIDAPTNVDGETQWAWWSHPAQYWQGYDDSRNKHDADTDGEFICEMRNNIEAMIEVVEAARKVPLECCNYVEEDKHLCNGCSECNLANALAKLEK